MTPAEKNMIMLAVPFGEADAEGWRKIWFKLDQWAPATLRGHLATLYAEGRVKRRALKTNSGFAWVYWQDGPADYAFKPIGDAALRVVQRLGSGQP